VGCGWAEGGEVGVTGSGVAVNKGILVGGGADVLAVMVAVAGVGATVEAWQAAENTSVHIRIKDSDHSRLSIVGSFYHRNLIFPLRSA
jgi:hypothetical protein